MWCREDVHKKSPQTIVDTKLISFPSFFLLRWEFWDSTPEFFYVKKSSLQKDASNEEKSVLARSNWRCLCVVPSRPPWMDGHWTHSINVDLFAVQRGQSPPFPSSAEWMCSLPSRAVTYFSSWKVCLNCKVEARLTRHSTQRADTLQPIRCENVKVIFRYLVRPARWSLLHAIVAER